MLVYSKMPDASKSISNKNMLVSMRTRIFQEGSFATINNSDNDITLQYHLTKYVLS